MNDFNYNSRKFTDLTSQGREFLEVKRVAEDLMRSGNLIHPENGELTPSGWLLAKLKTRLKDERKRVLMDQPKQRSEMRRLINGISQCLTKARRRWESDNGIVRQTKGAAQ